MQKGKGVSTGIGFGRVYKKEDQNLEIGDFKIEDSKKEIQLFNQCLNQVIDETNQIIGTLTGTEKEIMEAYLMVLQDPMLTQEILRLIEEENYNAGYATQKGFNSIVEIFHSMDNYYISGRAADIEDMKKRILLKITKKNYTDLTNLPEETILVAKELTTSDTAKLDFKKITGIITEIGGINSHVSIMARAREIPTIIFPKAMQLLKQNEFIAINGLSGEIFQNLNEKECIKLKEQKEVLKKEQKELEKYKGKETRTKDGKTIELVANIGTPQEVEFVINSTAEGIGLFRSEFLYMDSETIPTEEEQFKAYKKVIKELNNKPVIIRTLDVGGDKDLKSLSLPKETNPFLGYRAIRISLDRVDLFKTQIRALLRASEAGDLSIMLPMISSIEELKKAKKIIQEVKQELARLKIPFTQNIKIGIMIEIPAAAIMAEELGKECDFFSIGTNDLIQYTTAVERGNEKVEKLYSKFHPAVIRLIKMSIDGAHKNGIFCGMCGESAGDPILIPLLIGLGLDEFSMNPSKILRARKKISECNVTLCKKLANEILVMDSAEKVEKKLMEFSKM